MYKLAPQRYWWILGVLALLLVTHKPPLHIHAQELQVQVDNSPPQWAYTGTTNQSNIEWEVGGAFTASWNITEENPAYYILYWNQTGSNTTHSGGTYTTSISGSYDPVLSDVGKTVFFEMWCNDTVGYTNSSLVYFSVTNTNPPTVQIQRPENTTYTGGQIEIWISSGSYDLAVLWWALHYQNGTLYEGNVTWTETVTRTLADGQYYLIGYCNDTASLEDSETVYFTLVISLLMEGPGSTGPERTPFTEQIARVVRIWPSQFTLLIGVALGMGGLLYYFDQHPSINLEHEFVAYKKQARRQFNALAMYFQKQKRRRRRKPP